jgi:hypothetical protein
LLKPRFDRFFYHYMAYTLAFSFAVGVGAAPGLIVYAVTGSTMVGAALIAVGFALAVLPGYKFARFMIHQLSN